jgi:hypothetical protein
MNTHACVSNNTDICLLCCAAGKKSLAMEAFARALRQLPTTIADNAGLDSAGAGCCSLMLGLGGTLQNKGLCDVAGNSWL